MFNKFIWFAHRPEKTLTSMSTQPPAMISVWTLEQGEFVHKYVHQHMWRHLRTYVRYCDVIYVRSSTNVTSFIHVSQQLWRHYACTSTTVTLILYFNIHLSTWRKMFQSFFFQVLGRKLSPTFKDQRILGSQSSIWSLPQCWINQKWLLSSLKDVLPLQFLSVPAKRNI